LKLRYFPVKSQDAKNRSRIRPKWAAVNSQGWQPLGPSAIMRLSPEGAKASRHLTSALSSFQDLLEARSLQYQGFAPLAIGVRPFGAARIEQLQEAQVRPSLALRASIRPFTHGRIRITEKERNGPLLCLLNTSMRLPLCLLSLLVHDGNRQGLVRPLALGNNHNMLALNQVLEGGRFPCVLALGRVNDLFKFRR